MICHIEGFHTKLDQFGFRETNLLHECSVHGELLRPVDESAFHVAGLAGGWVKEHLADERRLAGTSSGQTRLATIGGDGDLQHVRVDVVLLTRVGVTAEQRFYLALAQVRVSRSAG